MDVTGSESVSGPVFVSALKSSLNFTKETPSKKGQKFKKAEKTTYFINKSDKLHKIAL